MADTTTSLNDPAFWGDLAGSKSASADSAPSAPALNDPAFWGDLGKPAPPAGPSLGDTLGNIADSIGYGVTNLPNLGADLLEKIAPLSPNAPVTSGDIARDEFHKLAQGADVSNPAAGLQIAQRIAGALHTTPAAVVQANQPAPIDYRNLNPNGPAGAALAAMETASRGVVKTPLDVSAGALSLADMLGLNHPQDTIFAGEQAADQDAATRAAEAAHPVTTAGTGLATNLAAFATMPEADLGKLTVKAEQFAAEHPGVVGKLSQYLTRTLANTPRAAVAGGIPQGEEAAQQTLADGGTLPQAYGEGAANTALGTLAFQLPASLGGQAPARAVGGAVLQAGANYGQQAASHAIAPQVFPQAQVSPEAAGLGALFGLLGGHGEAPQAGAPRAAGDVPALDAVASQMRAELKAQGLSDAEIDAVLNPAPEAQTAALPAPVVHVDARGNAATQAQAEAAQRAAQARAEALSLSPDVIAAQAARSARAPAEAAPAVPRALPPPVVHVDAGGNAITSTGFMQQLRDAADALQRQRELGLTPDVQRAQAARLAPELARQTQERANPSPSTIDAMLAEVEGRTPAPQGAQVPEPGVPEPAQEKVAAYFSNLPKEIGWEQRGGGIIRGQGSGLSEGDHAMAEDRSGPVIGRMPWIPKIGGDGKPSSFWRMRPDKALTEAQAHEAFRKIDAGEPLRPIEQRFVDYAQKTAHDYAQAEAEDTARFEAEQREADDIERQRAIEDLRAENARFATADHAEAFTVAQWARRAREAGMSLDEVLAALGEGDNGARISNLAKAIADKENARGTDTQSDGLGSEGGIRAGSEGQAAPVREGEGASGQEGAGEPEPGSAEAAAGQVRFSRPGTPPSGDLFGAPTSAERLRAAQEAKDAQRNGKTRGREPTGDGGLFDGERPEQARIAEPKQPDQLFRRPAPPVTHTPEQARATLRRSPLGRAFGKLEEAGALRIESHPDQDWSGYWDGDKAVLNAARAGEEGWLGTAMHELGGHGSLHDMLGDEGFARALSDIRSLADAKGPAGDIVRRAMRRVESADTPARHRDEELLAYTISEAVREGKAWKSGALNSALVRIFNRIRAWMKTSTIGKLLAKHGVDWKLNPDDIAALAESGIRRMAREASAPAHEPMAEPLFHRGNDGERDLIAQHNTTAEKLAHADRMGGLAVPSIGITRAGHPLQDFGDISLIGDKELVNPHSGAKVFGADAYTPRYPEVRFKTDATVAKNVARIIGKKAGERLEVEFAGSAKDLTHQPAFKRYAEAQLGDGYGYHQARALAEQVLREAGAKEVLFKGFTNMGHRRYIPHTLENVVKELKRNLRGGEGYDYGPGSIRAKYTPQFRSIEAIRKAKDKILAKADFEKLREEVDNDFFAVHDALGPYHPFGDRFEFTDAVTQTMKDAARMGISRALRENGFRDVTPEAQAKLGEFLTHLRNMPTHYFEAILPRAVGIHEFKSAVIPNDTKPETRALLERHGLNVHEYDNRVEGDRERAVREAAHDDDLMFSEAGHDQTDTPAFRRWFGDSKVVDAQGKPLVVYHGTPDAGFTVFHDDPHFTASGEYASVYTHPSASSINVTAKEARAPAVIPAYLKIERPFDTRNPATRRVFEREYFGKYGNATPLSERGLPDWTEARDLSEWIKETDQPYDGLIVDEGGTPEGGHRGLAYVPFRPEQVKSATGNRGTFDPNNPDIRFSKPARNDRNANFDRWFGHSAVVDEHGAPLTVYHGTADGFYAFDNARLGESTAHMTAPLGHFFAEDEGKAQRYAESASQGVPADERVIDAHLSIQNPKTLSLDDLMGIESQDEARALKAKLEGQGYDGIHIPEIGQWIAFDPRQIKSASENVGTFDRGNPDIRYSRPTPQDRAGEEGRGASGPGGPGSTGVKNEQVTRERAQRGLPELDAEGRRSFGQVWDAAGEKLRTDPHAGQALAQHIIANPRPLKAEETALLSQDRARIAVNRHAAAEDINRAVQAGDVAGEAIARAKLHLANDEMEISDKAARASGYEQGLGLAMRKAMAQLDYSLEGMESRLQAAKGTPLDETDLQRLKDLHVEMQANEAALAGRKDAQRAKQKETKAQLQEQLRLFKDQLRQSESRKDAARQKQLRKQIAELARRIVTGDYSKTARTPIQYNEETKKLEAQRNFLRKKFDRMAAEAEHKNRSKAYRLWHTFLAYRRMNILSGVHTLGRLTSAALLRIGASPIEHAVQHGLGWLPGVRGIAQRAPIEGRFSPQAEAHALKETFSKETLKEMALKFGNRGTNDLLYGKDRVSLHPWLDLVGQVHAALKTPSERNAFARSMAMLSEFEAKAAKERGLSPAEVADYLSQPDVNGYITARAYEESMRAIFKNDNKFVSALHAFQGMLRATKEGKSNLAGKAVAEFMDYLFPVQKIPTNYIGEAFSYLGGGAKALAQMHASKILKEGLDNLTPEAADYIMRNLGKQTVGAALLALGYLGYKGLGSFYQQGDNHKKHVREADSIGPVPGWLAEHPALLMLTAGANFHRIQDGIRTKTGRPMVGTGGTGDATLNTLRSLLEKTPYIYTIENLSDRFRSKQSTARYLGNEAASAVIQPDLKRYARESDTAPRRYPRGFTDAFEMNVPGLREHVPTHPQRRP